MLICCLFFGLNSALVAQRISSGMSPAQIRQMVQNSSKEDLLAYIAQAKASGYSIDQVKSLLRARGASISELSQLEKLWNEYEDLMGDENSKERQDALKEPVASSFGIATNAANNSKASLTPKKAERFGSDFFGSAQPKETPEIYIATPLDYQLGPGDELTINLFGSSEESYNLQVSREGAVKVDRLAPLYLSGLSIQEAKSKLEKNFAKIYTGLTAAENDPSKVTLDLSLTKARSVVVNITGQVAKPGTYTLSAFTSVINALYAAGGPNEVGSYRQIRLLRQGRIIREIDLYDFFVGGNLPSLYLKDQDVLQVPAFSSQVELQGAFKTTGYFDLKENESLDDLLAYSGGFQSNAYKDGVFISRIMNFKRESINAATADASKVTLNDGDVITARSVRNVVENTVEIQGGVYIPGMYSLESISTVKDLLDLAGGLTREALKGQATLFRSANGVERLALSIDLNNSDHLEYPLSDGDRIVIAEETDLFDSGIITIQGEVNSPGAFPYRAGMSLSDALIMANGFTANANKENVTMYRTFISEGKKYTQSETVSVDETLSSEKYVFLAPNALVVVRRDPSISAVEKVTLEGMVYNQGSYAIKGENYRLYDLLKDAGGFLENAYLKGISVTRSLKSSSSDTQITNATIVDAVEANSNQKADFQTIQQEKEKLKKVLEQEEIIIGIDGEKLMSSMGEDTENNIQLFPGDRVNVPQFDNTVTIIGEVQKKTTVTFEQSLSVRKAIRNSGGFSDAAKRSGVYVIYKNGTIKTRTRIIGLIGSNPRMEPGSTIVVPKKLVSKDAGSALSELVGISSSLATLFLLLQQIGL